jgi:excisionase family DNA binding protein
LRFTRKDLKTMSESISTINSYLNASVAAAKLGISESTLLRCVRLRDISHVRLGSGRGRVMFRESDLQDYVSRRTVPAQTQAQAA